MDNCASIVQQQLNFYNRKDIEGWLSTYANDAKQFNLHGEEIASGHEEMRQRITIRFIEPDLHAHLLSRIVTGNMVVDMSLSLAKFQKARGRLRCSVSTRYSTD
jgi:hypothetical protein